MFSVLVLLEDSKNVWSDHLPKKIGNPPAKNRFFHFRHAVGSEYDQSFGIFDLKISVGTWKDYFSVSDNYISPHLLIV